LPITISTKTHYSLSVDATRKKNNTPFFRSGSPITIDTKDSTFFCCFTYALSDEFIAANKPQSIPARKEQFVFTFWCSTALP
jgi:hypothetical protein